MTIINTNATVNLSNNSALRGRAIYLFNSNLYVNTNIMKFYANKGSCSLFRLLIRMYVLNYNYVCIDIQLVDAEATSQLKLANTVQFMN